MIKLVIFDLDGTLINSIYDLSDAVNNGLSEMGFPTHEVDEFYHFVGNGTMMLATRALPQKHRTKANIDKLHSLFAENYQKCCLNKTKPYDGIVDTIKSLKNEYKLMLAVASNKTDVFAKNILDNLFPADTFDTIVGKNNNTPAKPDPQMIYNIMEKLQVEKTDVIFVGDSNVDVATAHNAGLLCIGCEWGFRGRTELENAGADFFADTPKKIIDIINDLDK